MGVFLNIGWEAPSDDKVDVLSFTGLTEEEWHNLTKKEKQEHIFNITDSLRERHCLQYSKFEYTKE